MTRLNEFQYPFFLIVILSFYWSAAQKNKPFETVVSFFEAFHQKDSTVLISYFDQEAKLYFTSNNGAGIPQKRSLPIQDFVSRVCSRPASPVWEERLGDPEIEIHQNLATIWVPFEFYLDAQFSHSGFNFFQLFWNGKQWKITNLADTRNVQ